MNLWIVPALSCAVVALHHCLARRGPSPSDARETALVGAISLGVFGWWFALPALVAAAARWLS